MKFTNKRDPLDVLTFSLPSSSSLLKLRILWELRCEKSNSKSSRSQVKLKAVIDPKTGRYLILHSILID